MLECVSDFFQEASVVNIEDKTVKLRYTDATVSKLIQKGIVESFDNWILIQPASFP